MPTSSSVVRSPIAVPLLLPVSERVQRHEHVLRVDGLLLLVVAHLVGLGAEQVDELGAAGEDELAGVVGHPDVGAELLHHL